MKSAETAQSKMVLVPEISNSQRDAAPSLLVAFLQKEVPGWVYPFLALSVLCVAAFFFFYLLTCFIFIEQGCNFLVLGNVNSLK